MRVFILVFTIALAAICGFPRPARAEDAVTIDSATVSDFLGTTALSCDTATLDRLVPMKLAACATPAAVTVGVDCGMPEMCGIDPCLCGAVDAYGACACSGTQDVAPTLAATSSDDTVARIVTAFGADWVVPVSAGTATIKVSATLPHHADAAAEYSVRVAGPTAADVLAVLAALVLAALVVLLVRHIARRRKAKPLAILVFAALALASLSGCGAAAVGETSPRVANVTLAAADATSESTQRFDVTLEFDQPVKISSDVLSDLAITVNGSAPTDAVAVGYRCAAQTLTITFAPSEAASQGGSSGTFFALYQGQIDIASAREDGGLPHVTGADGAAAVLDKPVSLVVPSGLAFETVSADETSQTIRVTAVPKLRVISWISPDGGETVLLKHNHMFLDATPATCAADIADVINKAGCGFHASATGDTVAIVSETGATPDFALSEGLGAAPGQASASELMGEA
jgi:hypothetical protein